MNNKFLLLAILLLCQPDNPAQDIYRQRPSDFKSIKHFSKSDFSNTIPDSINPDEWYNAGKRYFENRGIQIRLGFYNRFTPVNRINASQISISQALGVNDQSSFNSSSFSFQFGVGFHIYDQISASLEYLTSGAEEDLNIKTSAFEILLLYELYSNKYSSFNIGAGIAIQQTQLKKDYNIALPNNGTLESISITTPTLPGFPIFAEASLIPGGTIAGFRFFIRGEYIIAKAYQRSYSTSTASIPYSVSMNAFLIKAGVLFFIY